MVKLAVLERLPAGIAARECLTLIEVTGRPAPAWGWASGHLLINGQGGGTQPLGSGCQLAPGLGPPLLQRGAGFAEQLGNAVHLLGTGKKEQKPLPWWQIGSQVAVGIEEGYTWDS